MLARGEGEVELFEAEDARMQVGCMQCRAREGQVECEGGQVVWDARAVALSLAKRLCI